MSQVADFDVADFEDTESTKGTYARFYISPIQNMRLSEEQGRPIFEDKEYIEIMSAGNANSIVGRIATERDKRRYSRVYAMFKAGDDDQLVGTRLTEIPWIKRSQIEELTYRKIRTVENLAEISDQDCNMPGMYELRKKARAWIQSSNEAAPFTSMMAEIEELKKINEELSIRVAQMEENNKSKKA